MIKPASGHVILQPCEEVIPKGGILLPPDLRRRALTAEVLAVCSRASVCVGDMVLISKTAGTRIPATGDHPLLLVVLDTDLLAVVSEEIEDEQRRAWAKAAQIVLERLEL